MFNYSIFNQQLVDLGLQNPHIPRANYNSQLHNVQQTQVTKTIMTKELSLFIYNLLASLCYHVFPKVFILCHLNNSLEKPRVILN